MKSSVHVPRPTKETMPPDTVQTLVVADVMITASWLDAATTGEYVGPFLVAFVGAADDTVMTLF